MTSLVTHRYTPSGAGLLDRAAPRPARDRETGRPWWGLKTLVTVSNWRLESMSRCRVSRRLTRGWFESWRENGVANANWREALKRLRCAARHPSSRPSVLRKYRGRCAVAGGGGHTRHSRAPAPRLVFSFCRTESLFANVQSATNPTYLVVIYVT